LLKINTSLTISGSYSDGQAIQVANNSACFLSGTNTINGPANVTSITISYNSILRANSLTITANSNSSNVVYTSVDGCFIVVGTLDISTSGSVARFIACDYKSTTYLNNITFNGTVTTCSVSAQWLSLVYIPSAATVSGTVTGKRYVVNYGSNISVVGAGANRIPGSSAGTADSASFGYYG
jgi:hypothetical protein